MDISDCLGKAGNDTANPARTESIRSGTCHDQQSLVLESWWLEHEAAAHSVSPIRELRAIDACPEFTSSFLFSPEPQFMESIHI